MSKKHKKSIPVQQTQKEKGFIIDQNKFNKQKAYYAVNFKTGAHKTAKDKPRKRYKRTDNWEDDYEL